MAKSTVKLVYYQFWLQSSRGTNASYVRHYRKPQTKDQLKADCEAWCEGYGAWHVSENMCSYGWRRIKKLPKNRRALLAKYNYYCARKSFWAKRVHLAAGLLACSPFNGQKV